MVRAAVAVDPVSWTLVPGTKTALIRLDQFSTGAADDLKKAVGAAREAGADRLVLDLRGNPGGYVNEADAVASQFLKSGTVFVERAADGHETTHPVAPGGVATDLPLIVLVDGGTASSAEIVSGAIQDGPGADRRHQDVRDRDGPRRVPAHRRVGPAGRDRRVADARWPQDLARGDRPGCRRRAGQRRRAARSRGCRQADPGRGRRDQGSAARARTEPRRGHLDARPAAADRRGPSRPGPIRELSPRTRALHYERGTLTPRHRGMAWSETSRSGHGRAIMTPSTRLPRRPSAGCMASPT